MMSKESTAPFGFNGGYPIDEVSYELMCTGPESNIRNEPMMRPPEADLKEKISGHPFSLEDDASASEAGASTAHTITAELALRSSVEFIPSEPDTVREN